MFDIEPRDVSGLSMSTLTADLAKLTAMPPQLLNQNGSVEPAGEHLASVTYLQERKRG